MAKRKKNYLNNADLLVEIEKSREQDELTPELVKMFEMLVKKYIKHPYYNRYYNLLEDMEANALYALVKGWRKFDPNEGQNPFAYYTQTVKNAFKQITLNEQSHRKKKDAMLVMNGLNPSFNYEEEMKEEERKRIQASSDNDEFSEDGED